MMTNKELLTFDHLIFQKHPFFPVAVIARCEFDNGEWISVAGGGSRLYGDGKDTFEVMSSKTCKDGLKNVLHYLSKEKVTEEMIDLQLRFLIL